MIGLEHIKNRLEIAMNFTIIYQEKKLLPFYTHALKEYHKRLQRYCKIQRLSCSSTSAVLKKINSNSYVIGVTIHKSTHTSKALANYFSQLAVTGQSRVLLIINPSKELLEHCDDCISLSSLTRNTGLILTILYEQIYRSYRINLNQAYHK